MKISLLSDIHAEFYKHIPNWMPPLPDHPDVLVLAGDIHVGQTLVTFVERIADALPTTDIIVIAGNHEFYRQLRQLTLNSYRQSFSQHPRIHFLDNDFVDIKGVRFIGATLWTNFPEQDKRYEIDEVMSLVQHNLSDFNLITEDANKVLPFSPKKARELCLESKGVIESILEKSDPQKTVVITHFPPVKELLHPYFPIDWISSYFAADCRDLVETFQPAYWFYGHNHWSSSMKIGNTKLISNQFCYPNERSAQGGDFDSNFIVEI